MGKHPTSALGLPLPVPTGHCPVPTGRCPGRLIAALRAA